MPAHPPTLMRGVGERGRGWVKALGCQCSAGTSTPGACQRLAAGSGSSSAPGGCPPPCCVLVPGAPLLTLYLSFSRAGWFCRLGRRALRRPVSVFRFRLHASRPGRMGSGTTRPQWQTLLGMGCKQAWGAGCVCVCGLPRGRGLVLPGGCGRCLSHSRVPSNGSRDAQHTRVSTCSARARPRPRGRC
jgi:hypothetical protein